MIEHFDDTKEQLISFFVKIILPVITGIAIRVAITIDKEKVTFIKILLSLIIGLGFVFLLRYPVEASIPPEYHPMIFGIIAMSGEYIGRFFISRFKLDEIADKILSILTDVTGMERIFKNLLSTAIGVGLIYSGIKFELSDWIRVFFVLLGIVMIFSKDTLFSRLGKLIDTVVAYFKK